MHCVVPEGGIAPDGSRWVRPRHDWFLPVKAMAKVFRGKFLEALEEAFAAGQLRFPGQMRTLAAAHAFAALLGMSSRHKWVVYAKRPFGGPEHVLQYLGNYTHRVAISNRRLVGLADDQVRFRWRDSAHHNRKRVMALHVEEFLRRFFLHVLPGGFVRIRHFGWLANRKRKQSLQLCRKLLGEVVPPPAVSAGSHTSTEFWSCPACGGLMVVIERIAPAPIYGRPPPEECAV